MNARPLTPPQQAKILALTIRGDTKAEIIENFAAEEDRILSKHTINTIVKDNKDTILQLRNESTRRLVLGVEATRDKANAIIDARLEEAETIAKLRKKMADQFLNGELTAKEYKEIRRMLKEPTIPELVTISKEMHSQAKPVETEIPQALPNQAAVLSALQEGDEVKLTQLIFKKSSQ